MTTTDGTAAPKENTAKAAAEPRPTKAQVAELRQLLDTTAAGLGAATREAHDWKRRAEQAESIDREAKALAGCAAAIDAMLAAQREADRNQSSSYGYATAQVAYRYPRPEALHSPVGRILLHLAARFGVAIEATVPPAPEGPLLVQAPRHLAEAIQGLVEQEQYR